MPRAGVSQLTLYPLDAFERAERATVLLTKLLQLAQGLGLSEREIRYLLTHGAAFDAVSITPAAFDGGRQMLTAYRSTTARRLVTGVLAGFGQFELLGGLTGGILRSLHG